MREILRLIVVLTLICIVAAVALAKVYEFTKAPIARQRRLAKLKAIEAVLPQHDNQPDNQTLKFDIGQGETRVVYIGTQKKVITGVAFEVRNGEGYGGEIVAMLGLDTSGTINGVEIIKLSETPGLGAKINNPEFKGQFKGKSLGNTKFSLKKDSGDLDQVTGATISPRAMVKAIKEGLEFFNAHQSEIVAKGQETPDTGKRGME